MSVKYWYSPAREWDEYLKLQWGVVHKQGGCQDANLMEMDMYYTQVGGSCSR